MYRHWYPTNGPQKQTRIQELEQQNDEFEQQFRQATTTLESFERLVDERLEANVMLQSEAEELREEIQALQEEIKGPQQHPLV
jgi:uncharacterized coiled-coil DUF342 family protein